MTAPKRRWFRWSLRTMFVVVTLFAVWLGYSLNWIRERDKILAPCREFDWHKKTPQTFNYVVGSGNPVGLWIYDADDDQVEMRLMRAPAMLWLFGELGHCNVE